jgi:ubiquinone/menaquinone biosynthesis C-methylase UbiE
VPAASRGIGLSIVMIAQAASDRTAFERLVAGTAWRPATVEAVRAELARQTLYQPEPDQDGLEELAFLLARSFAGQELRLGEEIEELERRFADQPLVHLYGFALRREAGENVAARGSLDALLEVDPGDPIAAYLDAHLRSQAVVPASEETRLANIAKFASTPLLKNPYSLTVGVLFEAIREQERARVLDIGVGSGAQMEGLLALLGRLPHGVRRLEIVGLDFMPEFLARAGERIAAAAEALAGRVEVVYEPVEGRIEALDASAVRAVAGRGLDAANATIALHEVAGEAKLAALSNLRRVEPGRLAVAEWNYCLENVLAETSTEFVFNVRRVAAAMVAALRERYTIEESRAVVGDWLSQGAGQLTCPAEQRQECFLDITAWKALLEHCDFEVLPAEERWLAHAAEPREAAVAEEGWYVRTSNHAGATPIAVLAASPA